MLLFRFLFIIICALCAIYALCSTREFEAFDACRSMALAAVFFLLCFRSCCWICLLMLLRMYKHMNRSFNYRVRHNFLPSSKMDNVCTEYIWWNVICFLLSAHVSHRHSGHFCRSDLVVIFEIMVIFSPHYACSSHFTHDEII